MIPLILIFSKFTLELLLLEFFFLFLFTCSYTLAWVLRKRKYGVIEGDLPAGPVKAYLSDLIQHTEELSIQLFGVGQEPAFTKKRTGLFEVEKPAPAPETSKALELEQKLADLSSILETTVKENSILSQELEHLKQKQQDKEMDQHEKTRLQNVQKTLSEKLTILEARLAEYSIIEEDLADLKRYQQENSEMKHLLKQNNIEFQSFFLKSTSPPPLSSSSISPSPESTPGAYSVKPGPQTQVNPSTTVRQSSTSIIDSSPQIKNPPLQNQPSETAEALTQPQGETQKKKEESSEEPRTTDAQLLAQFEKMLK